MTAPDAGHRYTHTDDARLARAMTLILAGPGLTAEQATSWLDPVVDALRDGCPVPLPPWYSNTLATLQSLYVHLSLGLSDTGAPTHAAAVKSAAADLLRGQLRWLGHEEVSAPPARIRPCSHPEQ